MTRLKEAPSEKKWMQDAGEELNGLSDVKGISGFLSAKRLEVIEKAKNISGRERTRLLSNLIDLVVRRMFDIAGSTLEPSAGSAKADRSLVVVATGGYGRQELAPFSDVDINFIASSDDDPVLDAVTRRMFRLIMDVFLAEAKLKVGYAYRLLGEAGSLHHQNQTALLDARYVAGNRELFQAFQDELRRSIHPVAFAHDKIRERNYSIKRRGGAVYRVEPDIKEGEGSLRDLQLASWLAQVVYGFRSAAAWDDMRTHGVLKTAEVAKVFEVQEFFSRIRWEMHLLAGRQADTLTVQKQEEIAPMMGYADTSEESAVESLMRAYYTHAQIARQTAEKLISRVKAQRLQLEPGLASQDGQLVLENSEAFLNDPIACLRAFTYCQRYGLTLSQQAMDAIRKCVAERPGPVDEPDAARLFLTILRSERVAETLMVMVRCGALQWYLPEFDKIIGLVPFDAAHEYTVGWHTLLVVHHCERLGTASDDDFGKIFASLRQPELLYLYALTHDIGKGANADHCVRGAEIAGNIARRLGMDTEAVNRLEFLVRNHLLMSDTARLRDLNLRKTVDDFVSVVNDVDLLGYLYILTAADILAVGSAAWSEIQGRFLRELYHRAERALVSKTPLIDSDEDMALYRNRVRRELSLTNIPQEAVEEHVALMPPIYLLNTGPEEMATHIDFIRKAREGEPSTEFKSEQGSDFTELTLCVRDDPEPGLLSKVAGVLWGLDINVHAAQVFTRENCDKIALDTLYVDFEGKQLPEFKKHQIHRELTKVLTGEKSLRAFLEEKNKTLGQKYQSLALEVHEHLSEQHTVVDIHAPDQPGLLYRFTSAFAKLGWDIHSARVSTWGDQARDSFYVTAEGSKLGPQAAEQLEQALTSV